MREASHTTDWYLRRNFRFQVENFPEKHRISFYYLYSKIMKKDQKHAKDLLNSDDFEEFANSQGFRKSIRGIAGFRFFEKR